MAASQHLYSDSHPVPDDGHCKQTDCQTRKYRKDVHASAAEKDNPEEMYGQRGRCWNWRASQIIEMGMEETVGGNGGRDIDRGGRVAQTEEKNLIPRSLTEYPESGAADVCRSNPDKEKGKTVDASQNESVPSSR